MSREVLPGAGQPASLRPRASADRAHDATNRPGSAPALTLLAVAERLNKRMPK